MRAGLARLLPEGLIGYAAGSGTWGGSAPGWLGPGGGSVTGAGSAAAASLAAATAGAAEGGGSVSAAGSGSTASAGSAVAGLAGVASVSDSSLTFPVLVERPPPGLIPKHSCVLAGPGGRLRPVGLGGPGLDPVGYEQDLADAGEHSPQGLRRGFLDAFTDLRRDAHE